jgi:sugar-specific transcriptional regulator TrmB
VSERDAVEGLERLGLSQYEAAVFVALQRLGTGTARDVADVTDVPRSQVYGAAERLAERGLIHVQQSQPIAYRPVPLDEARARLRDRFEDRADRAFDALASLPRSAPDDEQEAVWTVRGRDAVSDRAADLVADAEHRVVYTADPEYVDDRVTAALREAVESVHVVVASAGDLGDGFANSAVETHRLPEEFERHAGAVGRLLVVDDDAVLVSVDPTEGDETAIWSADTAFASVFIRLADTWFGSALEL